MSPYIEDISSYMRKSLEHVPFDLNMRSTIVQFMDSKRGYPFPFGHLTIYHYQMYGGDRMEKILPAAAAVEFLILAFDIFDDLQDQDNPSPPWMQVPANLAMNMAIALLPTAQTLLQLVPDVHDAAKLDAMKRFSRLMLGSVRGQLEDTTVTIASEAEYLKMIEWKSGSLCAAACMLGAVLSPEGGSPDVERYATQMGVIGQLRNDLHDLWRWDGKSDLLNKRMTLPIIYLLEYADNSDKIRLYYSGQISRDAFAACKDLVADSLKSSGVEEYVYSVIRLRQIEAFAAFERTQRSLEWKKTLAPYY